MVIEILNIIGVIVFSISGALKGLKYNLDILGVVVLGTITAIGGGILRDLLLNDMPMVLKNETDMYFAIVVAILTYIGGRRVENYSKIIKVFDAAGLAVFTIIGAARGMDKGLGVLGIVIMGTLTGVAGGVTRDLLVREIPFVLKEEVYALFCILGSAFYFYSVKYDFLSKNMTMYIIIFGIFLGRIVAVKYDLHLPKYKGH
ncbi:trimeric intracellular cation channel family protein [Haliovirga abyssi]|uniref:Membrane protein n=1 Tax=Haliovirga abyssi TaxID=2996794 RepID=A0AAU9DDN9_9FUSO|nr:trimeric intracellular cation channel family protein [Haliovirga abyssi]BDU50288.1 membrane protein [Haliovirga abyssi]